MKYLIKYFKPYILAFLGLVLLVFSQSVVNLSLPGYTAKIVNDGIALGNIPVIWSNGFIMFLITLLGGVIAVSVSFLSSKISTGYARKLREAVFIKVENFSLDEFNSFSSSSLITRATNDIQQIQRSLSALMRMSLLAPFMGVGAVIKANSLAPEMSWVVLTAIGVITIMMVTMFFVVIPKFSLVQKVVDKLGLQIKEMLSGIRVIRAYDKDDIQEEKFSLTNKESTSLNIFISRFMGLMNPVMTLVMGIASITVVWLGSYLVEAGSLQIGSILALVQYVSQAIMSFLMFSMIFILIPRAAVSVRRIKEILEIDPKIKDPEAPQRLPENFKGCLEFCDVSFSYQGSEQAILSNISFVAKPGETTAIIGGTGSGKSTLLNLIPRLYDVNSGAILLDGIDIREIKQEELRHHIAYVPQKSQLFSGTVASNIIYGKPGAETKEIEKSTELAQAAEFVSTLPKGLESDISQGASNISGGQKQRLAVARAAIKKAPIYLFDDSFSALDYKTDVALRRALNNELKESTVIIVGQRVSTIMNANSIIVLNDGKIVGRGNHHELLKNCSVYREIAESQLSEEELNEK